MGDRADEDGGEHPGETAPGRVRLGPVATLAHMDTGAAPSTDRGGVRLLDVDPGLGRSVPPPVRARLTPILTAPVARLEHGIWRPAGLPGGPQMLGLLILDGLLLREVTIHERRAAEMLGPGDVLRPWPDGEADPLPSGELQWRVVDGPAHVAVLDQRATLVIGRVPALMAELLDRTLTRAKALQLQLALTQVHGIDQRLELLFWHAAERWGRVTRDGVVVPLNLTHEMLSRLIGARRPSVTSALGRLSDAGTLVREPDGWVLRTQDAAALPVAA